MQEPYRKGSSESILTSSLAGDIVRCFLKRRQRHRWAGPLSCEKPVDQDADFIPSRRKAIRARWHAQLGHKRASESENAPVSGLYRKTVNRIRAARQVSRISSRSHVPKCE